MGADQQNVGEKRDTDADVAVSPEPGDDDAAEKDDWAHALILHRPACCNPVFNTRTITQAAVITILVEGLFIQLLGRAFLETLGFQLICCFFFRYRGGRARYWWNAVPARC